ncbi:hypothetical protein [Mucilaginibacter gilvus]|uniref:Uncharacterized protein n=1 Tax=Mucilaginibacter gilvus TaxID=2305909 RepID=A0A444MQF8_9SPHI|nr:hypothetical protein [Mucilaginibacter gilvus]RWY53878.1 hypothetical protein EPL05_07375 [Mucilaginibacter gilvus]
MFTTEFTKEQIAKFEFDFRELKTVKDKYAFWKNTLLENYSLYVSDNPQFKINPNTPKEFEDLNKLILEDEITKSKNPFANVVLTIEGLRSKFFNDILNVVDKKKFIQFEISTVIEEINLTSRPEIVKPQMLGRSFWNHPDNNNVQRECFVKAYKDCYLNGKVVEFDKEVYSPYLLVPLNNGMVYAQYHIFLNDQLDSLNEKKSKKEVTTLPKQLLLLHYLGILDKFDLSDNKKSSLFSILLNGDKENIRKALPNFIGNQLREIKNEKHLQEIANLLKESGLNKEYQTVQNDILKLKTGKL